MQDLQLALVISRLYESEFESASTFKKILQRHILGQDKQVLCVPAHFVHDDLFHKTVVVVFWTLRQKKLQLNKVFLCLFGSQIQTHPDPFLRSIAHWVLEDYSGALDTLLEQPVKNTRSVSTEGDCGDDDLSELLMACSKISLLFSSKTQNIYIYIFYL